MGERINIVICNSDGNVGAVLFSNSSHNKVDVEEIVRGIAATAIGPSSMIRSLLDVTYPSDQGSHKKGDPVFSIDLEPGDHEKVLLVTALDGGEELRGRGYLETALPVMKVENMQSNPDFEVKLHTIWCGPPAGRQS